MPPVRQNTPPTADQLLLFRKAAEELRDRAPWEFMYDRPIIAVEHPFEAETFYCSVEDAQEGSPGVRIYRGEDGLSLPSRTEDYLCMPVSFGQEYRTRVGKELREDLETRLVSVMFEGYPEPESIQIHGGPESSITGEDLDFLTFVLTLLTSVVDEIEQDPRGFLEGAPLGAVYRFRPTIDEQTHEISWDRAWVVPEENDTLLGLPANVSRPLLDEFRLRYGVDPERSDPQYPWHPRQLREFCRNVYPSDTTMQIGCSEGDLRIPLTSPQEVEITPVCLFIWRSPRVPLMASVAKKRESPGNETFVALSMVECEARPSRLESISPAADRVVAAVGRILGIPFALSAEVEARTPSDDILQREIDRVGTTGSIDSEDFKDSRSLRRLGPFFDLDNVSWPEHLAPIVALLRTYPSPPTHPAFEAIAIRYLEEIDRSADPSPILRGRPEIWACTIVYMLAWQRGAWQGRYRDRRSAEELCAFFGASSSTVRKKSLKWRKILGMRRLW